MVVRSNFLKFKNYDLWSLINKEKKSVKWLLL
jgi:hypothetical protein